MILFCCRCYCFVADVTVLLAVNSYDLQRVLNAISDDCNISGVKLMMQTLRVCCFLNKQGGASNIFQ